VSWIRYNPRDSGMLFMLFALFKDFMVRQDGIGLEMTILERELG